MLTIWQLIQFVFCIVYLVSSCIFFSIQLTSYCSLHIQLVSSLHIIFILECFQVWLSPQPFLEVSSSHLVQVHIPFAFTLALTHIQQIHLLLCLGEHTKHNPHPNTPTRPLMGAFVELQRWLEGWLCWLLRVAKPKQALVSIYCFHFDECLMHLQGFKLMFVCWPMLLIGLIFQHTHM